MSDDIASPAVLRATIEAMVAERGPGKTVCPSEVARHLAGADEKRWRLLMKPIRREAEALVASGSVVLRRKGRIVDPATLKGIYRIGPVGEDDSAIVQEDGADGGDGASADGAGNSASVRPVSR
ncbi:DUF3253 domain-containing protein [Mangrovicella endophytica]|uniref:DUF3253 domain-containing protein n=1 Tax=Mangrovicella endophytica TaxID=2066697 RepID=UPI000C9DF71D|nr:DUF3253 domain-containing protein [Mangrovicella endophytica]